MTKTLAVPRLLAVAAALALAGPGLAHAVEPGLHHDLDAARASLRAADAGHAAATAALGPVDGFASCLAADAYVLVPGALVLQGRAAARTWLAANVPEGASLSWFPIDADVSGDASRGYTFGWRTLSVPNGDGTSRLVYGKYASFWRRQGDDWVVVAHVTNGGPWTFAPAPPPAGFSFQPYDGGLASEDGVDPDAGVAALVDADLAFSDLSVAEGTGVAFGTWAAEDGVTLPGVSRPIYGKAAIAAAYAPDPGDPTLSWVPAFASIAQSGDLGFTIGYATATDAATGAALGYTKYLTIWALQPDGTWRFVLDAGNASPPPAP